MPLSIKKKQNKENSLVAMVISMAVVFFGLSMSLMQDILRAPVYIQASLTQLKKPDRPDFSQYNQLLKTFAKDGRVDYKNLKTSPLLPAAMAEMATTSPDNFKKLDDVVCYWFNAHNLIAIKTVCDEYPVITPLKLKREFISRRYVVGGKAHSAETIWVDCIHPKLVEKRKEKAVQADSIFLLCRAYLGYPEITDHAITAETMRADITNNLEKFIHNPANLIYKPDRHIFSISRFFQFYRDVFGQSFEDPWAFAIYYYDKADQVPFEPRLAKTFIQNFNWGINDINH
ncbi:DUF547 domain-containing protein [bacterium]|nr:DUF547 domain-containing protein [bacterium]MBP9806715.1 DUF547 domain-containing protein [bacterium]